MSDQRKLRVAAYCRVSSDHEDQLSSFENQVDYYTKYIQKNQNYEMVDIYTDEGITGTNTRKREGFNRMIADCEAGKIDLVITKSISRFARNTQDCLQYSRKLKSLGIGIIFEKENISTLDANGELLFTILSSLAQEESRNISENCKFGIRHNYRNGIIKQSTRYFLGYDTDENGKWVINPEQAKTVKRLYREFLEGWTVNEIAKHLNEDKVVGPKGNIAWEGTPILYMLQNEKYIGDTRLQKTYISDYLTKKAVKNRGEVEQYYVENSHEAIVSKEEWNAAQLEVERRERYCKEIGIRYFGNSSAGTPFISKVICGSCGTLYYRIKNNQSLVITWICRNRYRREQPVICHNDRVKEEVINQAFIIAWNSVVKDRDELLATWEAMKKEGNPLEKLRAKQMIELTNEGPLRKPLPELTRMVLERVIVHDKRVFTVRFLDGTERRVCVSH